MTAGPIDAIVLFGDSLTQGGWEAGGFSQRLAYVYARKLDVINRGMSGYNSEWALPVFEKIMPKAQDPSGPKIRLLTLWLGGNDSCLPPSPQYCPIPRFTDNLRRMVRMLQSPDSAWYAPHTRIVLITPPPMSEKVRGKDLQSRNPPQALDRTLANTKAYADTVIKLGEELKLPVVDVYTPLVTAADGDDDFKEFLSDGLHLTVGGYSVLYDKLIECINTHYPELNHETLSMVFPPWKELINPKDRI